MAVMMIAFPVHAEIKVDIIANAAEPISVAVQKIEPVGDVDADDLEMIRDVVDADLKSTGLFRIVSRDALPEFVKMGNMPDFELWDAVRAQVLVQAKLAAESGGRYSLEFYVWDVNGREQIEAQSLVASRKSVRRLAHIMADAIYERLTGEVGYFDTQIVLLAKRKLLDTDKYILAGILGMLLFQQIQNIGMTVGLFPITGITLPFISYGGSSLLSYMILVGVILNISMEKSKHYKYK